MNEEIGRILAQSGCPVCGAPKRRDVGVPRHGGGKNYVKWRCTNEECEESKHWNAPGDHPATNQYRRAEGA